MDKPERIVTAYDLAKWRQEAFYHNVLLPQLREMELALWKWTLEQYKPKRLEG